MNHIQQPLRNRQIHQTPFQTISTPLEPGFEPSPIGLVAVFDQYTIPALQLHKLQKKQIKSIFITPFL